MSNDLSEGWIVEEMRIQYKKIKALEECYKTLKVKDSQYAKGINKMLELRKAIFGLCATFKTEEEAKEGKK
jgi:hypothetical protein